MVSSVKNKEVDIVAWEICGAFTIKLRTDGILHSHTSSAINFDIDSLKQFNVVMAKMLNNQMAPLLITLDEFAIPPDDTRAFWAKKESCPLSLADAYVTTSLGHKIIGNAYLKFNKPGRPTKIFNSKDDAVEWLKTFL
ncbi:MAG TPA: hypothetical protein VN698_09820 [Bacteroidia bacterium]|nr:hypothetical protein [Bacteroidia bacterium]